MVYGAAVIRLKMIGFHNFQSASGGLDILYCGLVVIFFRRLNYIYNKLRSQRHVYMYEQQVCRDFATNHLHTQIYGLTAFIWNLAVGKYQSEVY
jgi:hypothetical protein